MIVATYAALWKLLRTNPTLEMKSIPKLLLFTDLPIAFIALVMPMMFVKTTSEAVKLLGAESNPVAYGYVLLLAAVAALCSRLRTDKDASLPLKAAAIDVAIVAAGAVMLFKVISTANPITTAEHVVNPYGWYALSVLFCLGNGYAIAELSLVTRKRGNRFS